MGSLFSSPKPPPAPAPVPLPDTGDEERQRRLESLERRRRGRTGLIATSPRGVLGRAQPLSSGKTLLGE